MNKSRLYRSQFFSIYMVPNVTHIELEMVTHSPVVNTKHFPNTTHFIETRCPSVLKTQCFNDQHLPFRIEIKETEIAHLLEHLILDELCLLKIAQGEQYAEYSGETSWNWVKEQRGVFHIFFSIPKNESLFVEALTKSADLVEALFRMHVPQRAASLLPAEGSLLTLAA